MPLISAVVCVFVCVRLYPTALLLRFVEFEDFLPFFFLLRTFISYCVDMLL